MPDEPEHLKNSEKINMDDVDILAYVSRCQPGPVDDVEVEVTKCDDEDNLDEMKTRRESMSRKDLRDTINKLKDMAPELLHLKPIKEENEVAV